MFGLVFLIRFGCEAAMIDIGMNDDIVHIAKSQSAFLCEHVCGRRFRLVMIVTVSSLVKH